MILRLPQTQVETDQRFLIPGVDWETYEKFLAAVGDRHIFLTYDGKDLEFMSPSPVHERNKRHLDRVIDVASEEANVPILGLSMTTLRRSDLPRGLEADECYYTKNMRAIQGKMELDLAHDPPPDLAIEIDITSSSLDRESIYAALRVPEIWRYDGEFLRFYCLDADGRYSVRPRSPTFPFLDPDQVPALLQQGFGMDDLSFKKQVRDWVRKQLAGKKPKTATARRKKPQG